MGDYVTVPELRAHVGIIDGGDDVLLARVVASAERMVDVYCGQSFTLGTSSARTFQATDCRLLYLRSGIATSTGVVVKLDEDDDGTFETTVPSTDWQLEPLDGIGPDGHSGWPYTAVRLFDAVFPMPCSGRPGVQITAQWGWAAVPEPVKEAALLLAAEVWKLRDAPLGTGTFGAGALRVEDNAGVVGLLGRFRQAHAIVGMA